MLLLAGFFGKTLNLKIAFLEAKPGLTPPLRRSKLVFVYFCFLSPFNPQDIPHCVLLFAPW